VTRLAGAGPRLHVTALPEVHQALLAAAAALDTDGASCADRKAYRNYARPVDQRSGGLQHQPHAL
jgi:hypothetical protein